MACRTCPQPVWPPASARVRPPDTRLDTVSADQFLLRTTASGWPGDGHGGPLDRPVGRTPQFKVTASPMGLDPVRTATAKRRTPPAPSVRRAAWPSATAIHVGLFILALTGQDGNAHAPSANPSRYQQRDPPVMTTCTHARCRNVRKPGPRPISARSCPASTMDATIGQPSGHPMPGRIWPDTVHSTPARHSNRKRADRERTNGTAGIRTSPIATTMKTACRDAEPPPLGPALRLGNQDRLGDGNTASATVTTSGTRQLLVLLHRSSRASAHCSPQTITGRA
jgi:hypothetical protein